MMHDRSSAVSFLLVASAMLAAADFASPQYAAAAPPKNIPAKSMTMSVHPFHPAGDGVTDDIDALQAAVNDTLPGGSLTLEANRRYAVSHPVDCRGKTIHIIGQHSTVVITSANYMSNNAFHFGAMLAGAPPIGQPWNSQSPPKPTATFSGAITAGQTTFPCALPAGVPVGSLVSANLGTCKTDHTLPDVTFIAKVLRNSGGMVTLDSAVPRDVSGSTHCFYGVVSLGDNSSIQNVGLDWSGGAMPDVQISADYIRNFRAENIFGRFSIAVNATYAHNINVTGVSGDVVLTSPAAGRVFGGWLMDDFHVKNVRVHQNQVAPVFFFEGNAGSGTINNVVINSDTGSSAWGEGVIMLDGTKNLGVSNLAVLAPSGSLVDVISDGTSDGSNHSGLSIENLQTNAPIGVVDMREINSGAIHSIALGKHVSMHYTVPITGNSGRLVPLAKGVVRTLSIKVPPHVTAVYFRPDSAGPSIQSPQAGQWITLVDGFATYRWDDPTVANISQAAILDDGKLPPGATIEVMCDTFPAGQSLAIP